MTEDEFRKRLSINLVTYRKLNGLTQAELADCISYSNKSVSKWERGEGVPDVFMLMTLSEVFGITVSELIGQTEMSHDTKDKIKAMEKDRKSIEKSKKKALERAKKQKHKSKK